MPTGATDGYILTSDASGNGSWTLPSLINDGDWTIIGNNIYSSVTGNVGIGTNNPGSKLDVRSTTSTPGIYAESISGWSIHANSYNTGGVSVAALSSGGTAVRAEAAGIGMAKLCSTDDDAAGYFNGNLYVENGEVGIGTTNPLAQFDVRSPTTSIPAIYAENVGGWTIHANSYEVGGVSVAALSSGGTAVRAEAASVGLAKLCSTEDDAAGYFSGNLYVENGEVGIGTTNPLAQFDVRSTTSTPGIYAECIGGWTIHANSYNTGSVSVAALSSGGTAVRADGANHQ